MKRNMNLKLSIVGAAVALAWATPGDAPELNRLARAAYARHVAAIGREPQPMATDWTTLFDSMEIWALDGPDGIEASLALEPSFNRPEEALKRLEGK